MKRLDNLLQPVAKGFGGKVEDVFDEGERPHLGLLVPTSTLVLLQQAFYKREICGEKNVEANYSYKLQFSVSTPFSFLFKDRYSVP